MGFLDVVRFVSGHPLNRGRRLAALGRLARWQLGARLLPFPVALPFVDDLRLFVERGMTGATGNWYCGLHEAQDMAFVLHFLRPGDTFYDVGANIGSYSLLAAAAGADRIEAFEPSPETATRFLRNIALNDLERRVSLHQVALGETNGEVDFSSGSDTTNHVLAPGETAASERVQVRRLDDFHAPGRSSFLKLDVEGFEAEVFAGARATLADPALMGCLVEDNGSGSRYGGAPPLRALLENNGFSAFAYDPWQRELEHMPGTAQSGNLLFLRDREAARQRVGATRRFRLVNGWI